MRTPEFTCIDNNLWQWNDWFIAQANGAFWLLTAAAREFGPFYSFEEAFDETKCLA